MAAPNRFEQFAQAPIVRPPPIERPEAIPRPGDAPARPRNRFQQFAPPAEAPQSMPPAAAEAQGTAEEPAAPGRFNFGQPSQTIGGYQASELQKVLDAAPPDMRKRILDEWQALQEKPDQVTDAAKSFGSGVVKGAIGLGTLPATLETMTAQLADSIGAPEWMRKGAKAVADYGVMPSITAPARMISGGPTNKPTFDEAKGVVERAAGQPLYEPQTTAGQYAQTVGEFVPGGFTPGGMLRKAANVAIPAVASETAGQATAGTRYEPAARVAGGLVGAAAPNIAMRAVTPFPNPTPERARQVAILQREGVPLTAGDITGRKSLRWAESAANDTPMSGQRIGAQKELQSEKFTEAALRRAGINAPRATDDVLNAQYNRLGQEFDTFAKVAAVPVTPQIASRVQNIARQYERITEPSLINPLVREIADDIMSMYRGAQRVMPHHIDGAKYSAWRSDIGAAARGTKDQRGQRALYDLQHILDDAAERFVRSRGGWQHAAIADRMRQARREYRNLIVISKARGAGEQAAQGLITPAQLQAAAKNMEGWQGFSRGRGDFTELARAGVSVMTPLPNSGTTARLAAQGLFTMPATAAGFVTGGPVGGAVSGLGAALSQGMMARGLMSSPVQAYLGNQTLARALQNSKARTPRAIGLLPATQ